MMKWIFVAMLSMSSVSQIIFADDGFRELKGHEGPPRVCLYRPDGKTLISASGWPEGDKTIRLWDVATGKLIRTFKGHTGFIDALAMSADGKTIISGSHDKTSRIWDAEKEKEIVVFRKHENNVSSVAIDAKGQLAATGDGKGKLCMWATDTGKIKHEIKSAHEKEIRCLAFSPDGKTLYSGSWDGRVKIWDVATGKETGVIAPECKKVENFVLFDEGKKLFIACDQGYLWDVTKNERIRTYGNGGMICCAVSPDKKTIMTGWYDGKVRQWKLESGELVAEYQAHEAFSFWIDFAPDGKSFATAGGGNYNNGKPTKGKDHVVRIWKFEDE